MTKTRIFLLLSLILPIGSVFCAYFSLRYLGDILLSASSIIGEDTANTLSEIFIQLKNASFSVHIVLPVVWYAVYCLIGYKIINSEKHPALNILWAVIIGIILFFICYGCSLLLTNVNGIRFGDILFSLIDTVQNGLFDVL